VRGIRVRAGRLALDGVVVEDVYGGDAGDVLVAVGPWWREPDRCGVCRFAAREAVSVMGAVAGGRSISGRRSRTSQPQRRACAAASPAWWPRQSRGPGTAPRSPVAVRIRSAGWRCTRRSRRSLSFSGSRGGRSSGSPTPRSASSPAPPDENRHHPACRSTPSAGSAHHYPAGHSTHGCVTRLQSGGDDRDRSDPAGLSTLPDRRQTQTHAAAGDDPACGARLSREPRASEPPREARHGMSPPTRALTPHGDTSGEPTTGLCCSSVGRGEGSSPGSAVGPRPCRQRREAGQRSWRGSAVGRRQSSSVGRLDRVGGGVTRSAVGLVGSVGRLDRVRGGVARSVVGSQVVAGG